MRPTKDQWTVVLENLGGIALQSKKAAIGFQCDAIIPITDWFSTNLPTILKTLSRFGKLKQ